MILGGCDLFIAASSATRGLSLLSVLTSIERSNLFPVVCSGAGALILGGCDLFIAASSATKGLSLLTFLASIERSDLFPFICSGGRALILGGCGFAASSSVANFSCLRNGSQKIARRVKIIANPKATFSKMGLETIGHFAGETPAHSLTRNASQARMVKTQAMIISKTSFVLVAGSHQ